MIDSEGFRIGVGIIVCNSQSEVLWARRIRQTVWQFPQGGIQVNETPEEALYRELNEEIGLKATDVKLLGATKEWLAYRYPPHLKRDYKPHFSIGQKQKWFLLHLINEQAEIRFDATNSPEFDQWQWVEYWHPLKQVINFKLAVYQTALKELNSLLPPS